MAVLARTVSTDRPEATTVAQAQAGDARALSSLLEGTARSLFPRALALTRDRGEATRLTEDALTRIFERLPQLRRPDAFEPWARRILLRLYLDERRALLRRPAYRLERADAEVAIPHDMVEVRDVLRQLSRDQRALLVLHYWERMTLAECAELLEIPLGTAKSRLAQALAKLRTMLGES